MYYITPEDYDINIFDEFELLGIKFNPNLYRFEIVSEKMYQHALRIQNIYLSANSALSSGQRKLRDDIIEEYNLDMVVKKIGNRMFFCNTHDIGCMETISKKLHDSGYNIVNVHTKGYRLEIMTS